VLAQEHTAELGESIGRILERPENALPVRDRQGDDRRLAIERGVQEGRRGLVDKVREYLHEFIADGDAGELHERDGIGRLLLVAFAREGAVEGRIPRCGGVTGLRCPLDLLVVVGLDSRLLHLGVVVLNAVVDFGFVVFHVVGHGARVPSLSWVANMSQIAVSGWLARGGDTRQATKAPLGRAGLWRLRFLSPWGRDWVAGPAILPTRHVFRCPDRGTFSGQAVLGRGPSPRLRHAFE
jgi:hypothetical protein